MGINLKLHLRRHIHECLPFFSVELHRLDQKNNCTASASKGGYGKGSEQRVYAPQMGLCPLNGPLQVYLGALSLVQENMVQEARRWTRDMISVLRMRDMTYVLSPYLSCRAIRQDFALKSFKDKLNKAQSGRVGDETLEASLAKLTDKVPPYPCAVPLAAFCSHLLRV